MTSQSNSLIAIGVIASALLTTAAPAQYRSDDGATQSEQGAEPSPLPDLTTSPVDEHAAQIAPADLTAEPKPAATKPPAAPSSPYKPLFYDNDFSNLLSPDGADCFAGDCLKQNAIGDCWMSVGNIARGIITK